MTQEGKELLFKDLSMRLPYHIYIQTRTGCIPMELRYLSLDSIPNVKPYLRPMDTLTDEEDAELEYLFFRHDTEGWLEFVLSHHLDWRDMIDKGLALKAPDYMYR